MTRRLAAIVATDVVGYSGLMERDEAGTLQALQAHRREAIDPLIAENHGRIVKLIGDGALAEFASVVDAVDCALAIQAAVAARNASVQEDRRIHFRVGVHIGDVIAEGDDIYGDGVNIAARIERLAEPGGVCATEDVVRQVRDKLPVDFIDLGLRHLKNLTHPVRVYRARPAGDTGAKSAQEEATEERGVAALRQDIRFCTAPSGTQLAYASIGSGAPLVKAAHWMTHLEFELESPVLRHWVEELSRDHTLVRYDQRGNGLSDREVERFSLDTFVEDLETVVDSARLDRFALLGISQGCAISVSYAVRHPERVRRLVLYGGYVQGWRARGNPEEIRRREALTTLIREGWGQDNPAFRQVFTSMFVPGGTVEQMSWFNDLQRVSTSPRTAALLHEAFAEIDVRALLPQVRAPTLVLHCRNDAVAPFDQGRRFASAIPGARFVPLNSGNHLVLSHEPAWSHLVAEVRAFLAADSPNP